MNRQIAALALAAACGWSAGVVAQLQNLNPVPTSTPDVSAEAQKHIEAARTAAGEMWDGGDLACSTDAPPGPVRGTRPTNVEHRTANTELRTSNLELRTEPEHELRSENSEA